MGLERAYLDYIEENARAIGGLAGKRMLEFGDQVLGADLAPETTGKEYYERRGVHHTSFDLSGQHGSVRVDLGKPFRNAQWLGAFDIVTNSGTSEHVEPFERQYGVFKNAHDSLVRGGIAVHLVPDADELDLHGHWKGHCNYYYTHDFFETLAKLNASTLMSSVVINGLRCVCIRKDEDVAFTADKQAILSRIAVRREFGAFAYAGINNHILMRPVDRMLRPLYALTRPIRLKLGLSRDSVTGALFGRRKGG